MDVYRALTPESVRVGLSAPDKWAVIEQLVDAMMLSTALQVQPDITRAILLDAVRAREAEKPTGMAQGFAFPHARIQGFQGFAMAAAILRTPVDFGATDGEPARFVCLIAVPYDQPAQFLKVVAQLCTLTDEPALTGQGVPQTAEAICNIIREKLRRADGPITAADIMRKPLGDIHTSTPLHDVTRAMLRYHVDAISVVEHDGTLVGEITSEQLFYLGVPDFFRHLKTISFISDFDPFEEYFRLEPRLTAGDVMSPKFSAVPESATIMEVLFEIAVRQRSKVYVVRDGKRIGVIDRYLLLDRVVNV